VKKKKTYFPKKIVHYDDDLKTISHGKRGKQQAICREATGSPRVTTKCKKAKKIAYSAESISDKNIDEKKNRAEGGKDEEGRKGPIYPGSMGSTPGVGLCHREMRARKKRELKSHKG